VGHRGGDSPAGAHQGPRARRTSASPRGMRRGGSRRGGVAVVAVVVVVVMVVVEGTDIIGRAGAGRRGAGEAGAAPTVLPLRRLGRGAAGGPGTQRRVTGGAGRVEATMRGRHHRPQRPWAGTPGGGGPANALMRGASPPVATINLMIDRCSPSSTRGPRLQGWCVGRRCRWRSWRSAGSIRCA
jgi:hypothetical protein